MTVAEEIVIELRKTSQGRWEMNHTGDGDVVILQRVEVPLPFIRLVVTPRAPIPPARRPWWRRLWPERNAT